MTAVQVSTPAYEDERGVIRDLITVEIDAVTHITTKAGAIRGNHVHRKTTQWTYVLAGRLRIRSRWPLLAGGTETREVVLTKGQMAYDLPGWAHAWLAEEDTECLVFTRGPRSGEGYETDTFRLAGEDKLF